MTEICNECGKSVAWGSGRFINRIPDANSVKERKELGRPYPEGDFICANCVMLNEMPRGNGVGDARCLETLSKR